MFDISFLVVNFNRCCLNLFVAWFPYNHCKFPFNFPWYIIDACTGFFEWKVLIHSSLDTRDVRACKHVSFRRVRRIMIAFFI